MKRKKIYIAGKISGLTKEEYTMKFNQAFLDLEKKGYEPISPIKMVPEHWDYEDQMMLCLTLVEISDEIYLLDNWQNSSGAKREFALAQSLSKPCLFESLNTNDKK